MKYKTKERLKDLLWVIMVWFGAWLMFREKEYIAGYGLIFLSGMIFNRPIQENKK